MHAAVVTSFDHPPTYRQVPDPAAGSPDEMVVEVLAAGLHPRVRSQSDGSHYTSEGVLPLVPGIDGVGRDADGVLRYFVLPDTALGAMAARTVIDRRRSIELPAGSDPVLLAAAMNPAMSSWVALRRRISLGRGARVLVLGATGNAGLLAVQVARHLGAGFVVGAGRRPHRLAELEALGADAVVSLSGEPDEVAEALGAAASDVDVVLDYLWGAPAGRALSALVTRRAHRGDQLTWVQIGAVAGPDATIASAALRAARLEIVGSGQGSVPTAAFVAELPALAAQICAGTFQVKARAVPLADVEATWGDVTSEERIVFVP